MKTKNKSSAPTKGLKDSAVPSKGQETTAVRVKKSSEYGKQLHEKQRVKRMYGLREAQFKRFFQIAKKSKDATGSTLLVLLERRLDNVLFRLKLTVSRIQARQLIVHGHVLINGIKTYSPSCLLKEHDVVTLSEKSKENQALFKEIFEKGLSASIKVPEWLELNKQDLAGKMLRLPIRSDIHAAINENYIVELYSK